MYTTHAIAKSAFFITSRIRLCGMASTTMKAMLKTVKQKTIMFKRPKKLLMGNHSQGSHFELPCGERRISFATLASPQAIIQNPRMHSEHTRKSSA
jgi:hypothetical protein